ncbi:MAG: glycosyltransferase [Candidatus Sumerlaeota bacterium]|nr:glycosyltransferase [Candidatus Sumerlaeota bacterium]
MPVSSPKLSLCMIVRDEAPWIEPCLSHHAPFVDEIVVADTGSQDGTDEIAERCGARVLRLPWRNDFAAARNAAIQAAKGPWILALDADELITEDDLSRLRELIASGAAYAYRLTPRTYTNNSSVFGWRPAGGASLPAGMTGYFDVELVRLFLKDSRIRFEGEIHELIEPSIVRAGLRVADSGVIIHHYKNVKSTESAREKNLRYLQLSQTKAQRLASDAHAFEEWGQAAFECGNVAQAIEAFGQAVALQPDSDRYALQYGLMLTRAGELDKAAAVYAAALERFGENAELLAGYGEMLLVSHRPQDAAQVFLRCLKQRPDHYRAMLNLSAALIDAGNFPGALAACEAARALRLNSDRIIEGRIIMILPSMILPACPLAHDDVLTS